MSAPTIPNLNSLRRGGPRLRGSSGRGRGASTASAPNGDPISNQRLVTNAPSQSAIKDRIIRATDSDAATSRLSAVACGYLSDPFAALLHSDTQPPRRLPLMNRGTYVRTTAIDRIVDTFLSIHRGQRTQIISLGAGSDTRYFRLHEKSHDLQPDVLCHEFDLAENVEAKIARLRRPEFVDAVNRETDLAWPNPLPAASNPEPACFVQGQYSLRALDLRSLSPTATSTSTTTSTDPQPPPAQSSTPTSTISTTHPTLLISECCLCYLPPALADTALSHFTTLIPTSTPLAIVLYEPTRPFDAFGRTMTQNLAGRGISLPTLQKYGDLDAQRGRLAAHGFSSLSSSEAKEEKGEGDVDAGGDAAGNAAADIDTIWRSDAWLFGGAAERERVEALEWMDEVEEFVLLGRHYVVAWGWRGYHDADADADGQGQNGRGGEAWRALADSVSESGRG